GRHRARNRGDRRHFRSHDRAGAGQENRRRRAGRRAAGSRSGAILSRRNAMTAASASAATALSVDGLLVDIGRLTILHGISLEIEAQSISLLLGANGAGKTTFLRTLAGLLAPREGRIALFGASIAGSPPHLVARAGVGHVPSGRELFPRMTVADHLLLGG